MLDTGPPKASSSLAKLKLAAIPIFILTLFLPVKAEEGKVRKAGASATAYASAKIHRRIEIRSSGYTEGGNDRDEWLQDISRRDCDDETRKRIKNCVLMIYEIQ